MIHAVLAAQVGLRLLAVPLGWSVLGAAIGVVVALIVWRVVTARRAGGRPHCAACGHQIAVGGSGRCVECGRDLAHPSAIRWDRRHASPRRAMGATIGLALAVTVSALIAAALARPVAIGLGAGTSAAPRPIATPLTELIHRGMRNPWDTEAYGLLRRSVQARDIDGLMAIRDALLDVLGPDRLDSPSWTELNFVGSLLGQLLDGLGDDGGWNRDPEHRHAELVRRAFGSAVPAVRARHQVGQVVALLEPTSEMRSGVQVRHRLDRVLLDGEPVTTELGWPPGRWRPAGLASEWFTIPAPTELDLERAPVRELRIEWTTEVRPMAATIIGSGPTLTIPRVHTQRLEIVAAEAPTIVPTRDAVLSPWSAGSSMSGSAGSAPGGWHVEIEPLGDRQVAGVVIRAPGRATVRVDGVVMLEQDGRSLPIGDPLNAIDPRLQQNYWQGAALIDPPFDLTKPITLRFEPHEPEVDAHDPHDFWWAEPFAIELRPDDPIRAVTRDGRTIWWGGAERRPDG